MSDIQKNKTADRYPGLWPFRLDQTDIFHGRDKEKYELFNRVRTSQVTIVFAKSGIGKSSLLNAGVVPLLTAAGYLPLNISLTKTGSTKLVFSPLTLFKNALKPYAGYKQSPFKNNPYTLWDYFKSCEFETEVSPVLIFDQFEELFAYSADEINSFLSELSELIHELPPSRVVELLLGIEREERNNEQKAWVMQPSVKFIFAIRSDKLAELQKVDELIPGLFINRYQLLPMNEDNAKLAIIRPASDTTAGRFISEPFTYDETALTRITKNLRSDITAEIEPYQLQIICRYIEEKVKASYTTEGATPITKITVNEFDADTETDNVLHNYYEQQLAQVGNTEDQQLCRDLLEKDLLEQSGNSYIRIRLSEGKVKSRLKNNNELLLKLLEARLIKPETDDYGLVYYQISHDSLKDPILKSKFESDAKEHDLSRRTSTMEEARKLINEHYECLKNEDAENALLALDNAEGLFNSITDIQGIFETGILIAKVRESKREFATAKMKLAELMHSLNKETEHRNIGILNECFGVIASKEGEEHVAFDYFRKALENYEAMPGYDQVARMSEHLGGIKEELFYNFQRDNHNKKITEGILSEGDEFYNNASKAYALINDNFGYERVKRSLRRLQENRVELERPGFAHKAWGYFTELFTGKVHALKGKGTIRIGRDVYNLKNEIGFQPKNNYMSRRHASITPDLVIEDTQSLNGTTINNFPLYYGDPRKLETGDIVVLANTMPMLFTITDPDFEQPPAGCWAILVDGAVRKYHYLTKAHELYTVSVAEDKKNKTYKLVFETVDTEDAVMKYRLDKHVQSFGREKMVMSTTNEIQQWRLRSTAKNYDRNYINFKISLDNWEPAIVFPIQLQLTNIADNPEDEIILANGPAFQLIIHEDYK
jgi:FHA domain